MMMLNFSLFSLFLRPPYCVVLLYSILYDNTVPQKNILYDNNVNPWIVFLKKNQYISFENKSDLGGTYGRKVKKKSKKLLLNYLKLSTSHPKKLIYIFSYIFFTTYQWSD